jgi:hypothetical protein
MTSPTKADASAWLAATETAIGRGDWLDPDAGRVPVGDYIAKWIAERPGLAPRTVGKYEDLLRLHIRPVLGSVDPADLTSARVRAWRSGWASWPFAAWAWWSRRRSRGRDDLHFHALRHTGNTFASSSGASLRELMAHMGHSSPRAALIDQHATKRGERAIVDFLAGSSRAGPTAGAPPRRAAPRPMGHVGGTPGHDRQNDRAPLRPPRLRLTWAGPRGADDGIRTRDPHLGKVMLYQLSHVRVG